MSFNTSYTALPSNTAWGLPFSKLVYNASLAATTDTTVTIPGSSPRYKAVITGTALTTTQIWMAINATAAAPAGTTFAAATSLQLPNGQEKCREVKAGDVLHFYSSAGSGHVSIELFSL